MTGDGSEQKSSPAANAYRIDALQRLIDLYTAWNKPDEAAKWRKTLDDYNAATNPPADSNQLP